MITDGRVIGLPLVNYADTQASIEALTLAAADVGAFAWATDTAQWGVYDGAAWVWSLPGVWSDPHDLAAVNSIQFELAPGITPAEGQICWDPVSKTLVLGMPGGNVFLNIGQESIVRVKAAENIADGSVVYVSNVTGTNLEVSLARADNPLTCHPRSIYIATEAITSGQHGYVCRWGAINGIPLSVDADGLPLADNDVLYLSATVYGGKVKTPPDAPNYLVKLGGVIHAHATDGIMSMSTYLGGKLSDSADVGIGTPATLDLLEYDATAAYWKNVPALKKDAYRFGFVTDYAGAQQTAISFDGTNIFTLAPTGTTWDYYRNGKRITITGSKTVTLSGTPPAAKGLYYIFIDADDGTLSVATASWTLEDTKVLVATIAWDNTLTPKYWLTDERHTCAIDRRFHWEHHFSEGTEIVTPPTLSGLSVAPPSPVDANNTCGITQTVISDEDLKHILTALTDPEGLSADYVTVFRTAISTWNWEASLTPFRYTAAGYIQYDNAGTMTQGQGNKYYNTYLLLTNLSGAARFVWMHGQAEFSTLAAAQNEKFAALARTGIPVNEFVACFQMTWETSAAYSTLGKCRLAATPVPISIAASAGTATGGATAWGTITGTLADQTDLKAALDAKTPTTRTISTTAPLAGGGDLSADRTLTVGAASEAASGVAELATTAEAQAGTDTERIVTPAGLRADVPTTPAASRGARLNANGDLLLPSGGDVLPDAATDVDHGIDKRLRDVSGPVAVGDYGYNPKQLIVPESAWYTGATDGSVRDDFFTFNASLWSQFTGGEYANADILRTSWLRLRSGSSGSATPNHAILQASITGHTSGDFYVCRFGGFIDISSNARVGWVIMQSDLLAGMAWWYTYNHTTKQIQMVAATYSDAAAWLSHANALTSNVGYTTGWTTRFTGTATDVSFSMPQIVALRGGSSYRGIYVANPLYIGGGVHEVYFAYSALVPAYAYLFVEGNLTNYIAHYFDFTGRNVGRP